MFKFLKHRIVNVLEKTPKIQIFIYNNLRYFKFLLPHDKDYYALHLLFKKDETRSFLDVGGNIGLSTLGFRQLGYHKNDILVFEPDNYLFKNFLEPLKKNHKKMTVYNFGLSDKKEKKYLFQAYYKNLFLHFNNSFDLKYVKRKIQDNYPTKYKKFSYQKKKLNLIRFDELNIKKEICFVKIDVEGFDHLVLKGMKKLIARNFPIFLIEFNVSNFIKILNLLGKKYNCFIYLFEEDNLKKLNKMDIKNLLNNKTIDLRYSKNSFNIYFVPKNYNF